MQREEIAAAPEAKDSAQYAWYQRRGLRSQLASKTTAGFRPVGIARSGRPQAIRSDSRNKSDSRSTRQLSAGYAGSYWLTFEGWQILRQAHQRGVGLTCLFESRRSGFEVRACLAAALRSGFTQ